ncbi:MAG: thioredoxin domain-containing protein [Acidobacteria bacterium]|nr:thioredoxin domain-containing protein [Acidobacteriota bacterium]
MTKEVRNLLFVGGVIVAASVIGIFLYQKSSVPAVQTIDKAEVVQTLIRPDSPTLGPENAKVTVVEFLDPECESCAAFGPTVKKVMSEFQGNVRLVIRYMPFHKNSRLAAAYLEAAGEQGKYWEMMDKMFVNQSMWGEIHGGGPQPARPEPSTLFDKWAGELGLNMEQLKASVGDPKHNQKVERDFADGRAAGVRGTPTFFVNGRRMLRLSEPELRSMIQQEMNR